MEKQINSSTEQGRRVPKLRFPEFKGQWEKKKLGEVGEVKMCRRIFNEETMPIGEIPFFKIGSFGKKADAYISKELYLNYRSRFPFPKKGDILISAAGTIGRTVIYNGEDAYYQDSNIVWIANDYSNISNEFLFYILNNVKFNTEGGTIQRLYNNILKSTKFSSPTLPEQKRIATFLTVLDKKIAEIKQKKNLLEQYKKGVMQKLFSQELRFKDEGGKEFPEWKIDKIKNYIDFLSGYPFKGEDISEDASGIPLLRGASITEGLLRRSIEIDRFYCGDTSKIKKYFLKKGDLVIGMDGSKVGRNSALINSDFENALLVQRVARIRENPNAFLPYIYHHINSWLFHRYVDEIKTSSGIPHISASQINDFKINFPCYNEQVKIGNFITLIAEKITRTESQIQQTQQYKKGLLQKMFC